MIRSMNLKNHVIYELRVMKIMIEVQMYEEQFVFLIVIVQMDLVLLSTRQRV